MTDETRLEIVITGVRWANNILCEILSNHAHLDSGGRNKLREAVNNLEEARKCFADSQMSRKNS
jgi:hypothetical protein